MITVGTSVRDIVSTLERAETCVFPASRAVTPTLQMYWMKAFVRHYGDERFLAFTTEFCDGSTVTLVPFERSEDYKSLHLSCDETADFTDVFTATANDCGIGRVLSFWIERGVLHFIFERLPLDSPTIGHLVEYARVHKGDVRMKVDEIAPYIAIDPQRGLDWARYSQSTVIQRYFKKRTALGPRLSVDFAKTFQQFLAVWPAVRGIHIERWKAKGVESKYNDPRRIRFIEEVCEVAASRNELFLALLRIDGKIAAFILAFWVNNKVFDWNTAFAPEFRHCSPGALLLIEVLYHIERRGVERYDFLTGCEAHKFMWATRYDGNVRLELTFQ